ncbi:Uncharacterised protein [Vibrio cholerae]|uniref:Uncharacterized protein n=1 Tax=Vibrio cholerae TaxID=666 RepID=A0A655RHL9_VIBCL|nr:Uncharacterised protein [Vibrio cholerae]CSA47754.1 Uncharacterised protein [Vibrio cholerae]CSB01660.1 Uncharacterised protein [Vibrio cholerae]CSD19777.1 Uncharacterised protein [Vibrio cholerae]CSD82609.1 Uncharacterised protein [Vibrio cholerae]
MHLLSRWWYRFYHRCRGVSVPVLASLYRSNRYLSSTHRHPKYCCTAFHALRKRFARKSLSGHKGLLRLARQTHQVPMSIHGGRRLSALR